MLQRIRSGRKQNGDAGVATSILVMGTALLLAGGFLIFGRIAQAGDMRNRAQIGADAAALGALAPLRDQAVSLAMTGIDPSGAGYWAVGEPPESYAKSYAEKNTAELKGNVHLTGMRGDHAKVDVTTKECQLKRTEEMTAEEKAIYQKLKGATLTEAQKKELRKKVTWCTDNEGKEGIGRFGTATAIARMITPDCVPTYGANPGDTGPGTLHKLICAGVQVYPNGNRDRVTKLFKIRLVDRESTVSYTGMPDGGLAGGGGVVASECIKTGDKPADTLSFGAAVVSWALCWRGTPYRWGGGNTSGPSRGICCSPGGHDGSIGVGFDCSGLTLYAVFQASRGKIALGHYTGNQIADPRGRPVPIDQMQAGDLIFFGNPTHHVAIYYGDGKMVEAPQTGDVVKISPLAGRGATAARRFG